MGRWCSVVRRVQSIHAQQPEYDGMENTINLAFVRLSIAYWSSLTNRLFLHTVFCYCLNSGSRCVANQLAWCVHIGRHQTDAKPFTSNAFMILQLALGLILIFVCVSVPLLHMGLYRYLSGRLSKDMGNEPED